MPAEHRAFVEVSRFMHRSFEADGERQVSAPVQLWFRNGGRAFLRTAACPPGINRKFTPNQISRTFHAFSPSLPQCKYFRFIDGC
jgi:hypothetical protein